MNKDNWKKVKLGDIIKNISVSIKNPIEKGVKKVIGLEHLDTGSLQITRNNGISEVGSFTRGFKKGQMLFSKRRIYLKKAALAEFDGICSGDILVFENKEAFLSSNLLPFIIHNERLFEYAEETSAGSLSPRTKWKDLAKYELMLPPIGEQERIAKILWAVEDVIRKKERLLKSITKFKMSVMQSILFTGIGHLEFKKINYQGKMIEIPSNWEKSTIDEACNILDSKRIPINSKERAKIKGKIPYYGANGVVDFINKHIFDEDLILLAEDGGNFDQFASRPIAYKISGKSWVNNHAHVLKSKYNWNQDWIFYNIVHKNIKPYINPGTRAKLNQSDLRKIPILKPPLTEQIEIASILASMDKQIKSIESLIEIKIIMKKHLLNHLLSN
ncbi:MAG: Type-1 restriction enzyme MjaXIP specificity protein [Candidatus Heimdallarchaeota archaeon LC_2]|nr:MAG: Type-1 restriction enzyme MjaXIP specificity protein [Candidatus Heimdallarchaeota archaeon LC_2]